MGSADIECHCQTDTSANTLLQQAMSRLNLSARAYHRILKVARTIADLDRSEVLLAKHIGEAVQYRRFA